ncbi:hypothetical protein GDO78_011881 [Eleutherodactylus coqui]|uniref:Uncharacterized protein n=1 Tax=Eleutherodactylus coqui TaxID=57060 RepID=A0A8J6F1R5_ELECQ|nr:hypothetical protein GDO78_011881 [Eleutherodactylus coqui]
MPFFGAKHKSKYKIENHLIYFLLFGSTPVLGSKNCICSCQKKVSFALNAVFFILIVLFFFCFLCCTLLEVLIYCSAYYFMCELKFFSFCFRRALPCTSDSSASEHVNPKS